MALGGRGGEIELRTADNELLATAFHPGGVASLAFSADGRFLASGGASGGTVLVWERADRKELRPLHGAAPIRHVGQVRGVVFAPGEPLALLTVADKVVRRWDWQAEQNPPTWKEGIAYRGHLDRVWSAAFSSDGRWILSGSEDATVRLWNRATGREIAQFLRTRRTCLRRGVRARRQVVRFRRV